MYQRLATNVILYLSCMGMPAVSLSNEPAASVATITNPDLEQLRDFLIPLAKSSLEKRDGYYPFSASISTAGAIVTSRAYDVATDPDPRDVQEMIVKATRRDFHAGKIRAAAICTDVTLTQRDSIETSNEIAVRLESSAGESYVVHIPYKKVALLGMRYGTPVVSKEEAILFHEPPIAPKPAPRKKIRRR